MFLDMGEVADYCKVTSAADQALLEADAITACQMVVDACGPIESTPRTELAWSNGTYCRLDYPVAALTTVTGVDDVSTLTVVPGGFIGSLVPGTIQVTYNAGYPAVPDWAKTAALAYTKWLWQAKIGAKGNPDAYRKMGDQVVDGHRLGARP